MHSHNILSVALPMIYIIYSYLVSYLVWPHGGLQFPLEHRATRFIHLWRSLVALCASLHVTPKPCKYSANIVRKVFCGFRFSCWSPAVFWCPIHGYICRSVFRLSQHMTNSQSPFTISDRGFIPDILISCSLLIRWYSQYFSDTPPMENVQSVTDLCCRFPRFTFMFYTLHRSEPNFTQR